jgi:hypothetical protein
MACFTRPPQLFNLFSIAGHCGQLSCAALSPILSVTTQESIQESVAMLLRSLNSVDNNEIGPTNRFSFVSLGCEDPVVTAMPSDSRSCY